MSNKFAKVDTFSNVLHFKTWKILIESAQLARSGWNIIPDCEIRPEFRGERNERRAKIPLLHRMIDETHLIYSRAIKKQYIYSFIKFSWPTIKIITSAVTTTMTTNHANLLNFNQNWFCVKFLLIQVHINTVIASNWNELLLYHGSTELSWRGLTKKIQKGSTSSENMRRIQRMHDCSNEFSLFQWHPVR